MSSGHKNYWLQQELVRLFERAGVALAPGGPNGPSFGQDLGLGDFPLVGRFKGPLRVCFSKLYFLVS